MGNQTDVTIDVVEKGMFKAKFDAGLNADGSEGKMVRPPHVNWIVLKQRRVRPDRRVV
jgi:hypothetical protein